MLPFLSDDEIDGICAGLNQSAAKVRYIRDVLKVPVERKPNGRPLVRRVDWEQWKLAQSPKPMEWTDPHPPAEVRRYQGSGLQRYHREQRADALARKQHLAELDRKFAPLIQAAKVRHRAALVRHHAGKRRSSRLQRTPAWADLERIKAIYAEAQRISTETGVLHVVDHDVPLLGKLVSGLHVHENLKIITALENSRKRNKFEVE